MMYSTYLALKDNLLSIFLSDKTMIAKEEGVMKQFRTRLKFVTTLYESFHTIEVVGVTTLICIPKQSSVTPHPDFIDVTENERFVLENMIKGSVCRANVIIEGSDGVGKSTLVSNLAQRGILCQDRAVRCITKQMKPEVPREERIAKVEQFLKQDLSRKVVFIYLSDEAKLMERIQQRGELSKYDKNAVVFQRLYVDTYEELRRYQNLYLLNCDGKSQEDMVWEMQKII